MKKLLFIAFFFPPSTHIGAQRPYGLAKNLGRFGWEAVVLTPLTAGRRFEGLTVVETDYKDILTITKQGLGLSSDKDVHEQIGIPVSKNYNHKTFRSKAIRLVREILTFPDEQVGWYRYALIEARRILRQESIDAIVSTSYPVTAHLVASKLKREFDVPWIADLRDLWTQNHYYSKRSLFKALERRLEVRTLKSADALVSANPVTDTLKELHHNRRILCITNGFLRDDYTSTTPELTENFTITYTGILYNGKRDPSMLLEGIAALIREGSVDRDRVRIRFVGCDDAWLREDIRRHDLQDVVSVMKKVPRDEAVKMQRESQLLLLLLWDNKDEERIYPGKVFEYLAADRPILAYGGSGGVVRELLDNTKAGHFATDVEMLKLIIFDYYREYASLGKVSCRRLGVESYAYENIAEKYAAVLDDVAGGASDGRWN